MNIPDAATLRKAIAITTKIEGLQDQLRRLFIANKETSNSEGRTGLLTSSKNSPRRGRPSKQQIEKALQVKGKKLADEKKAFSKITTSRSSSLKGKPRASSPSGPLGPAVLKVLKEHVEPMKVAQIFEALQKNNYQWTARNPLQTLHIRMPKLQGIIRVEDGKYALSDIPVVPAKRGRKAKQSLSIGKIGPAIASSIANQTGVSSAINFAEEVSQLI